MVSGIHYLAYLSTTYSQQYPGVLMKIIEKQAEIGEKMLQQNDKFFSTPRRACFTTSFGCLFYSLLLYVLVSEGIKFLTQ